MKKRFPIIVFSVWLGLINSSFAQYKSLPNSPLSVPDTVYYLADTARAPKKERIVSIVDAYLSTNFFIHCSCLETPERYIFLKSALSRDAVIDKKKFKSFKLTTLAGLISIVQANNTLNFDEKHVVYIIEPLKKGQYTLHRVVNKSNNIIQTTN